MQPSISDMQRAWEWLAQWGFQKPTQSIEINGGAEPPLYDYKKLSLEELAALETSLRKAAGIEPADTPPAVMLAPLPHDLGSPGCE